MDRNHDIEHMCKIWSQALPDHPQSWDDGICGSLVVHLLFGVEDHVIAQCSDRSIWRKQVVQRCGDKRGVKGQHADDFCHDIASAGCATSLPGCEGHPLANCLVSCWSRTGSGRDQPA